MARSDQEPDHQSAEYKPKENIQQRRHIRTLPEGRRLDHRVARCKTVRQNFLHILLRFSPAGKPPRFQRSLCSCLLVDFFQESQRSGVGLVDPCRLLQDLSCFFVLLFFDMDQRQKMITFDQLWILAQDLFQLDRRYIFVAFPAAFERAVVFLDRLIDHIQLRRLRLQLGNIFRGNVVFRHDIFADDPFAQRRYRFTGLKINKSKKISCLNIQLIKFETSAQHVDRSGQIPDLCLVQPKIIIHIGKGHTFSLYAQVKSTIRTEIHLLINDCLTIHTIHRHTLLFFLCFLFGFHHFL